jgi:hypothetical protein
MEKTPIFVCVLPLLFIAVFFISLSNATIPAGYTGTPFSFDTLQGRPQQIPGVIKGVFFDNGGEGVAFHESNSNTQNQGGSMRKNAAGQQIQADFPVDMQNFLICRDHEESGDQSDTGSWFLGWTFTSEWQKHTVHVNTAGIYYVTFHMAESDSPNIVGLTFYNGTNVTSDSVKNLRKSIIPSDCGCGGCEYWHAWGTFDNVDSIALDTGLQVFQLSFIQGNWNFDKIIFTLKEATGVHPQSSRTSSALPMGLGAVVSGERIALSYTAFGPAAGKIILTDCTGRTVASLVDNNSAIGRRDASLNVRDLRQGVYFVHLEHNGRTEAKSITVTH